MRTLITLLAALSFCACYKRDAAQPTTPEPDRFGNFDTKDARNAAKTIKTTEASGVHTPHVIVDTMPAVEVEVAEVAIGEVSQGSNASPADSWRVQLTDLTDPLGTATNPIRTSPGTSPAVQPVSDNGSTLTVDGTVALGAGAAAIGSVTVTSVVPGTAATSLGKAEDAAHAPGDTGVPILCRRVDTAASSAGASADYATVDCDGTGRLYTRTAPANVASTAYVVDATSASSTNFPTLATSDYRLACWQVVMLNTTTPAGSFSVQASIDGSTWDTISLDRVYGENYASFSAGDLEVDISSPAGTVGLSLCVENTFPFMRLVYARTSGGAAGAIDVFSWMRAQ